MSAGTPRRLLLALAWRALSFPNASREAIEDEVAALSSITDQIERERAFAALIDALRAVDAAAVAVALDRLTASPLPDPQPASPPSAGRESGGQDAPSTRSLVEGPGAPPCPGPVGQGGAPNPETRKDTP